MNLGYHSPITKYLKKKSYRNTVMYINVARINNRASTRQVDCPASLDTYSLPRSLNSTKHGQATLYLRSCIIVLINFIIIIFEIYVHKKLIYFVRREGEIEIGREREREYVREK